MRPAWRSLPSVSRSLCGEKLEFSTHIFILDYYKFVSIHPFCRREFCRWRGGGAPARPRPLDFNFVFAWICIVQGEFHFVSYMSLVPLPPRPPNPPATGTKWKFDIISIPTTPPSCHLARRRMGIALELPTELGNWKHKACPASAYQLESAAKEYQSLRAGYSISTTPHNVTDRIWEECTPSY